jgi:hypothetical protein
MEASSVKKIVIHNVTLESRGNRLLYTVDTDLAVLIHFLHVAWRPFYTALLYGCSVSFLETNVGVNDGQEESHYLLS